VIGLATGVAATIGPVLGGVLMMVVSGGQAVLLCAVGMAIVTVFVTASRTLRRFPAWEDTEQSPDAVADGQTTVASS
jgi:hypothetical protein